MNERLHIDLDNEADKLGSYALAKNRANIVDNNDTDNVSQVSSTTPKSRGYRPTGKHTVEPSGRDIERMMANKDAIEHPMTPEERQEATRRGVALARAALPTAVDRALAAFDAEVAMADPDDRTRSEHQAELAYNARMRQIADRKSSR